MMLLASLHCIGVVLGLESNNCKPQSDTGFQAAFEVYSHTNY